VAIVSNAPDYQLASECAKMILLTTASLRGAHLQSAQSAYERACIGVTLAEIEQARPFAQSWRPCRPTGPTILGSRERRGTMLVMRRSLDG